MARILSFGAGLVGTYVCDELAKSGHDVTAVALNHATIPLLPSVRENLSFTIIEEDAFSFLARCDLDSYDLVLNLLPGRIGDAIRKPLIIAGAKICDLAFSDASPARFASLAEDSGAAMIHDCGIAPGVSNMVVVHEQLNKPPCKSINIRVGGNPTQPDDDWSYCAPFSPTDVIEEYTRPARIRVEGETLQVPALSDRHLFNAGGRGEMEAFLTDGLRSLLTNPNITAHSLGEYTVRWPGHIDKFCSLRDKGALDEEKLVGEWAWGVERSEFTYMDITTITADGKIGRWEFDIPGIDPACGRVWPSMAVATGIPYIVACEALLDGKISGIQSPDNYIEDLDEIIERLRGAGAKISRSTRD